MEELDKEHFDMKVEGFDNIVVEEDFDMEKEAYMCLIFEEDFVLADKENNYFVVAVVDRHFVVGDNHFVVDRNFAVDRYFVAHRSFVFDRCLAADRYSAVDRYFVVAGRDFVVDNSLEEVMAEDSSEAEEVHMYWCAVKAGEHKAVVDNRVGFDKGFEAYKY